MSSQVHYDDAATMRLPPEAVLDGPGDRLALTLFGVHTCREAAALLRLDPIEAAQMLLTMLRESRLGEPHGPTATTGSRP